MCLVSVSVVCLRLRLRLRLPLLGVDVLLRVFVHAFRPLLFVALPIP